MNDTEYAHELARIERIQTLLDLKRPDQALQEALQGLAQYPESYYLHYFASLAHLRQEHLTQAEEASRRAINLDLSNGDGFYLRSIILHKQLNFTGELEMAKEAARLEPENELFLGRLVEAHIQSGELAKAKEAARQITKLDPGSAEAHEQLAGIHFQTEDWKSAEESFRNAMKISPTWTHLHQNLAYTLRQQKRLEEAIEVLFIAVKLEPTNEHLLDEMDSALRSFLPSPIRIKAHEKAIEALPSHLQYFYRDRHDKRSGYQNYSMAINALGWIGGLILLSVIFGVFAQ